MNLSMKCSKLKKLTVLTVLLMVGLSAYPANAELATHYKFENNANDSIGTQHGTEYGIPTYVNGITGSAINFDGDDDYIQAPDGGTTEFTTASFTIAAWLETSQSAGSCILIWNGTNGTEPGEPTGCRYGIKRADGKFEFFIDDDVNKTQIQVAEAPFVSEEWVHFAAVRDTAAEEIRLYANGRLLGSSVDTTGNIASPNEPLYIGSKYGETSFYTGLLDDLRFYDHALTGEEVAALVSWTDLSILTDRWLAADCNAENLWCNRADFDYSGDVNLPDFAIMAANWRKPSIPPLPPVPWMLNVIDDSSSGADGVRLADVDNDGLMDITTGWEQGGITRVYLNPGYEDANKPWPGVTVGQAPNVEDAVFVDLDNDGAVDVVSSCEGGTEKLFVHWAPSDADYLNSAWTTAVIPASDGLTRWMFCVPMQVDEVNGIDLVAGSKDPDAQVGWFEAPPNPRSLAGFQYHFICDASWIMSVITSDMDGDGDLDVVVSDRKESPTQGCRWLENPGSGPAQSLPWANHFIGGTDEEVMFMKIADLDQDGMDDVVVADKSNSGILYFQRLDPNGLQWQRYPINFPANAGSPKAVAVDDIDKDGRQDIVFTCEGADGEYGVGWLAYVNDVTDTDWIHNDISGLELGIKYDRIELLDLDGDTDLDVLTCEEREGAGGLGVIWYENPLY